MYSGWALAARGATDEGVERIRQGLRKWHATGSVTYETYFLGLLADALGQAGDLDEASRVLEEALDLARRTGEKMYEAELYRMRGEMSLRLAGQPPVQQSEADFRRALQIARRQESKSLELRAATSLTHLSRRLGTPTEARDRLAEALGWFIEGLETPDLQDARHLCADSSRPG